MAKVLYPQTSEDCSVTGVGGYLQLPTMHCIGPKPMTGWHGVQDPSFLISRWNGNLQGHLYWSSLWEPMRLNFKIIPCLLLSSLFYFSCFLTNFLGELFFNKSLLLNFWLSVCFQNSMTITKWLITWRYWEEAADNIFCLLLLFLHWCLMARTCVSEWGHLEGWLFKVSVGALPKTNAKQPPISLALTCSVVFIYHKTVHSWHFWRKKLYIRWFRETGFIWDWTKMKQFIISYDYKERHDVKNFRKISGVLKNSFQELLYCFFYFLKKIIFIIFFSLHSSPLHPLPLPSTLLPLAITILWWSPWSTVTMSMSLFLFSSICPPLRIKHVICTLPVSQRSWYTSLPVLDNSG